MMSSFAYSWPLGRFLKLYQHGYIFLFFDAVCPEGLQSITPRLTKGRDIFCVEAA
jgi:hypothetical protein